MKFYDTSRPLYQTDASSVHHGAGVPQVRDGMNCGCNKIPENATLHPLAFTSKSLLST